MLRHIAIVAYLAISVAGVDSVIITTRLGQIKGAQHISRDGRTYYAFTSVPFAKPPVGQLRLKNPVRAGPWHDVMDATNESPKCLQVVTFPVKHAGGIIGQEDCLYLSIYTPDLKPKYKLPVLFHTHGGGFRMGDGGPKDNADYFMDEDVILVNVHYRLGTLGFMSTEDDIIPGNYGLKDQSMALHWVKENIKDYGGDDEKITVFGVSAGGASAHYHLMSPSSKSILRGGIVQSGSANARCWAYHVPGNARNLAMRVAKLVGCEDRVGADLLRCLQEVPAEELYLSERNFTYWMDHPLVQSRPVIEANTDGAFVTFDPANQETALPMITGVVRDEGLLISMAIHSGGGDSAVQEFIDNIDEYLYKMMEIEKSCPLAQATVEKLKARYFPEPLTVKSTKEGLKLFSEDSFFIYPMGEAVKNHKGPLYQYLYDYKGGLSMTDMIPDLGATGVSHADDLIAMFNLRAMVPKDVKVKTLPTDAQVSKNLIKLWTNFARYQKPTLDSDSFKWPKYDNKKRQYLRMESAMSVGENLKTEVIEWWSKLPIFNKSQYNHGKSEL